MNLETYNQSNAGNNFNFTNPEDFQIVIDVLNQQLPPLLDDFKPAYVNYNMTPEYATYENNFNNIRDNIININSDLFTITNDIEMNIQQISVDLQNKDQEIQSEKQQNANLKSQQQNSDYKNNGSYQMINDYKELSY